MGEDEWGFDDVADLAWAGGHAVPCAPASGEHGEPTFAQAAQATQQGVAGAGVDIEHLVAAKLFDWRCTPAPTPLSADVGNSSWAAAKYLGAKDVLAGRCEVVDRFGFDVADSECETGRC